MRTVVIRVLLGFCFCLSVSLLPAQNQSTSDADNVNREIQWTEVPKVDREDPTLQRGIVYDADGKPVPGAKIYAASNIELFEIRKPEQVSTKDLGEVRAVTDHLGRFECHTPDLTWTPASGERKRWEALLVATKDGFAPGWLKTWGQDRGFRSHWNPHVSKDMVIHMAKPAKLKGTFLNVGGDRLADATIKLTSVNIPRGRSLDTHIDRLRKHQPGMFGGSVGYQESFSRPWIIPGLVTETKTDSEGNFELDGLPKDHIVRIEVTHPSVRTTQFTVAVREMLPIVRKPNEFQPKPAILLRGSGLACELKPGVTLRGQVRIGLGLGGSKDPAVGATVALANHNARDGMTGKKFQTDDEGRFVISGLGPDYNEPGYQVSIVGSFKAPIESKRVTLFSDHEDKIAVRAAVPYRLKLTDSKHASISREVYSIVVQKRPDQTRKGVTYRYDAAVEVKPGVYEGIVPNGLGAVIVKRGSRRDRPAMVDPKEFFEPGRSDWTAAEERYAYGDQWQIIQPGVITTSGLMPHLNSKHSQLDMAAVVLTKGLKRGQELLQFSATVYQDEPSQVSLVDQDGNPVEGARIQRQLNKYNEIELPSTFAIHGLHPKRAEFLKFIHDKRQLIGSVRTTRTDKPITVVMKPTAEIRGSIVDREGNPIFDFGIKVSGAVLPHTFLGNYSRKTDRIPKGTFAISVTPGETYSGMLMRKTYNSWYPRPTIGQAFKDVIPKPGEVIDLGKLVVPGGNKVD